MKLPRIYTSLILNDKHIGHAFFEKEDAASNEYDFSAPLNDELALEIIDHFKLEKLLVCNQKHTANVVCFPSQDGFESSDAIITKERKVGLLIRHADCQAALFYDPKNKVIGAAHAGYRGQILKIYSELIKKLISDYESDPKDLKIAMSASLCLTHSEFKNYESEFPKELHRFCKENHMDLKKMATHELLSAGAMSSNIDIPNLCTYELQNRFYSYRKDKTPKRIASLIFLK